MRRQFDILVLSEQKARPQIEDVALGWFFEKDFSNILPELDAEWTILLHPDALLTRDFLNATANLVTDFPYADAFAPRIVSDGKTVSSGYLLDTKKGFVEEFCTNKKNEMRNVASLSPFCGIYSTRLLKSLGSFDSDFKTDVRFFDLGLRALHLGASLFAVPFLQIETKKIPETSAPLSKKEIARAYYKDLDFFSFLKFAIRHPAFALSIFDGKKSLDEKSLRTTELSRLTPEMFEKVTVK